MINKGGTVPAGLYSKLTYNVQSDMFEITTPDGEITEMEPTQESLDQLGVTGNCIINSNYGTTCNGGCNAW